MKVLLDECVDWRLSRDLAGHEVKSARQMGWTTIKNGELLRGAPHHDPTGTPSARAAATSRSS